MNICLVGSLLSYKAFDEIVKKSKAKPSNAPENFQMMLAKGLRNNNVPITALAFPTMATYPNGAALVCHKDKEIIEDGIISMHMPMINLQGLKQFSIFWVTYWCVKKWIKKTSDDSKYVLIYSDYPPYASAARLACKGSDAKIILIMTDLPTYKDAQHKMSVYTFFMNLMDKRREANYQKFDGYIILTKYMARAMGIENKPYTVVEGFADPDAFENFVPHKNSKKTLMYAGALSEVHNIRKLIDGFMAAKTDALLWIYGDGDQRQYVEEASKKDCRIQYKGKVDRADLLQAQKNAHLLVSVKSTEDEHTLYAFPSKILEYMTSGTAVLTTRVGGIPEEYFDCVYTIDDESVEGIANAITACLELSENELVNKGLKGFNFAAKRKNINIQASCIIQSVRNELEKELIRTIPQCKL